MGSLRMVADCGFSCVSNGLQDSRTCDELSSASAGVESSGEIMLFGVRVRVDPMRKSVSLNNLSQYEHLNSATTDNESMKAVVDDGYASADDDVPHRSSGGRDRKRGVPWTEEEHKLFLLGLQKVGKGNWRGISRNYVKTRTPTQVASHAQKYFLRRTNLNRRRRRSSLFDITTHAVSPEEGNLVPPPLTVAPVLLPLQIERPMENLVQVNNTSAILVHPLPVVSLPCSPSQLLDPSSLSLKLSMSLDHSSSMHLVFPGINGDTVVGVA
ncbi:PREDICTED: transcription factor MYB1R1-like [Ipomoea nil]|uniref:transcription factor MYB1R1-like n=1 Tax=Ipomoea nil TaxID=35883 RepID=UPI000901531C|nr:PREDICTED: transcription factor MYB1R1-like [Ipomoea nil]